MWQKIAKSDISLLSEFSFPHGGSSVFNVSGEQVLKLGAQDTTVPIPELQNPAQSYPHLLTDIKKKKSLTRASWNKAVCREGGEKVECYNWLFSAKKKRRKIITGGDGRCDSPGNLAKYGLYLITDMDPSMVRLQLLLNPSNSKQWHITIENWSYRIFPPFFFFFKYPNHCNQYQLLWDIKCPSKAIKFLQ